MSVTVDLHRSLARQLRRLGLSAAQPPDLDRWVRLLDTVSSSYCETDADRYTLERSIEISSAEMKELHEVLSRQANQDVLTGLPNRSALTEVLTTTLAAGRHHGRDMAVLFLDVDGFKVVNDSLGHSAGDSLLVRVAERICGAVRDNDVVARLGGDEFIVVCPDLDGADVAVQVAQRIADRLERPFRVCGQDVMITASIGIALGNGLNTPDDLLRNADLAMYTAKGSGRSQFVMFDDAMRGRVEARLSIENALRQAINGDELVLFYQPIVRLSDCRVTGMEGLIRWNRPGHGMVPPNDFIPVAEESRLITAIDTWAVKTACQQAAAWADPDLSVSVNLTARDLQHPDIVDSVSEALRRSGLPAHRLVLEIVETTLVSGNPAIAMNLNRLRELGARVAIDDFGTGYSSFAYLRHLPAQTLKIDRSFVNVLDSDEPSAAIVGAIINMGHALGLKTVAEGVERPEQAQRLRELGCDAAQGYLFARPQPVTELAQYIGARLG